MITRAEKNKKIQQEITKEENQKRFKKITKVTSIILVTLLLTICYGMFIGAKIVVVKEQRIVSKNLPSSFHGLKIVQISDLLYNSLNKNDLTKIKKQINELKPDIIIYTGNLTKEEYKLTKNDIKLLENFFKDITATISKYAVVGPNDNDSFYVIMENSNFKVLNNEISKIYYKETSPIEFIGFNSQELKYDNLKSDNYSICILHNPDSIDEILENINCHIAFAGGTLGGEIKIFNAPLFDNHKYNKDYQKIKNTKLYISNGLGNEINVRYFNHPNINLYRLVKY